MKRNKKIIAFVMLFVLLFTNYVFADTISYQKNSGDANLNTIAKIVTDSTYVDNKYSAKSLWIPTSDIKIYKYNTTTQMTNAGNESDTPVPTLDSDNNAYYLSYYAEEFSEYDNLYATFKIPTGDKTYTNVATIVYKNAISYKGKKYDVKLDIAKVIKEGEKEQELRFHYASREIISGSKMKLSQIILSQSQMNIKNENELKEIRSLETHPGISCCKCGMNPIIGNRYCCIQCDNVNFCDKCEEEIGFDHGHPLYKFKLRIE